MGAVSFGCEKTAAYGDFSVCTISISGLCGNAGDTFMIKIQMQARFTIEAAILVPLVICSLARGMLLGIQLFSEVRESTVLSCDLIEFEPTEWIWKQELVREGMEYIRGN